MSGDIDIITCKAMINIFCANEDCDSINRPTPLALSEDMLLLIEGVYHCPYCRGTKFVLRSKIVKRTTANNGT